MRESDLKKLRTPYPEADAPERFATALGLDTHSVRAFQGLLTADLDTTAFGFGWWVAYEPGLGTRARIAIADHMVRSAESVVTNLLEASLHHLELLHAHDVEAEFVSTMASFNDRGELRLKQPSRLRPLDDLARHRLSMHAAGFFRAIASAFDCMGACAGGVLGLERNLLEQTWGKAQRDADALPRGAPQRTVWDQITRAVRAAGPAGWLKWTMDYRHMLVHRARRMEVEYSTPRPSTVLDARGLPHLHTTSQALLPRHPSLSEVESALANPGGPLTEDASTTLLGISRSANTALAAAAETLTAFWKWRKENVDAISQPAVQWPNRRPNPVLFKGYAPSEVELTMETGIAGPQAIRRWRAAS